jgi:putative oxidoreductase
MSHSAIVAEGNEKAGESAFSWGDVGAATRFAVPVGRALYSSVFIGSSFGHLFAKPMVEMAKSSGVPLAEIAVPLSGLMALAGGLSVLLGYHARIGAALLAAFLIPVTLFMHPFWAVSDPMAHQIQMVMFLKNIALLGGALLLVHFGAGPLSLDARKGR